MRRTIGFECIHLPSPLTNRTSLATALLMTVALPLIAQPQAAPRFSPETSGSQTTNVSPQVRVTQSGFGRNHTTGLWVATLTVTNTGGSPILGPLNVVLTQFQGGSTAYLTFNGDYYVTVPGVGTLNPGQSASVLLEVINPTNGYLNYVPRTFSGPFPPPLVSVACPVSTATPGTAYSSALVASNGALPYTYSISGGGLPGGLMLDASTGAITGMPAAGNFPFTAQVPDSSGGPPATSACTIQTKTDQTITFTSTPPPSPMPSFNYTVSATATSALPVSFTIDAAATSVCSAVGNTVTLNAVGTCIIDANQAGNATFNPAPQVQQAFGVTKTDQTITFTSTPPPSAKVGVNYAVSATATSALPVSFTIDAAATSVCSATGNTVSLNAVGTCIINANQAGNTTVNPAPQVQQAFAVTKTDQTIAFTSTAPIAATVGGPTYTPTANASSGLGVTFTIDAAASAVCSLSGGNVSFVAGGTCIIDANQSGNATYNAAPQMQQSFHVFIATPGSFIDTTQADFQSGTPTNLNLTASPNNVLLAGGTAIDQQNTTLGTTGAGINTFTWGGQTFTPSVSGQLVQVDINLFCGNCTGTTPNLTLSIRPTSGGLPTGADLVSGTITGFSNGAQALFYTATFGSPLTVTAGTQYAIIIRPTADPSLGTYVLTRSGAISTGADVYAGGTRVQGDSSGTIWSIPLTGATSTDAGFIVYIQQPFPASGDLISSLKDSNPGAGSTTWSSLSWTATTPANTSVKFQAAASNSSAGPFNFVGPDSTAATFYTTSGASLSQFNGARYLKYRAFLNTTDTTVTPTLSDVTINFATIQ